MCAGYDYNPTLLNLQCLILGLKDLTLKFKKKKQLLLLLYSYGAFHLSELAGRTSLLANEMGFFQRVLLKNHLLCAYYLGFD